MAGCSSRTHGAGAEAVVPGEGTPCSETPGQPSCTEAKPVWVGSSTGDWLEESGVEKD